MNFDFSFDWGGARGEVDPIFALNPRFYANYTKGRIDAYSRDGDGTANFTADRVEGANKYYATKIAGQADGNIVQVTEDDTPRIISGYYDEGGYTKAKGLLLEGVQATNLLPNYNTLTPTDSSDAEVTGGESCPFGDVGNLVSFEINGDEVVSSSFNTVLGTTYHVSFYVKKGTKSTLRVSLFEVVLPSTFTRTTIIDNCLLTATVGEWERYEGTAVAQHNADLAGVSFLDVTNDTGTVEICGLQVTEAYVSSTIPSDGTAMTRNSESLLYPATNNLIASIGTLALAIRPRSLPTDATSLIYPIALFDGNASQIYIQFTPADAVVCQIYGTGFVETSAVFDASGWTDRNELFTIIATYAIGTPIRLYINGSLQATSPANVPAQTAGSGNPFAVSQSCNLWMKNIVVFNTVFNATAVSNLHNLMVA